MIEPYERRSHYCETDQMGVIHHSNYIRWFEEARVDLMDRYMPYKALEERGVVIPVTGVSCDYHKPVKFGDVVLIELRLVNFRSTHGLRFEVDYRVTNKETGELLTTGQTRHCFTDRDMKIMRLKRDHPDVFEAFGHMEQDSACP